MAKAYEVEIIKGKFKGVKGVCFQRYALFLEGSSYPNISVFDRQGNEYWVGENEFKDIGTFEYDDTPKSDVTTITDDCDLIEAGQNMFTEEEIQKYSQALETVNELRERLFGKDSQ